MKTQQGDKRTVWYVIWKNYQENHERTAKVYEDFNDAKFGARLKVNQPQTDWVKIRQVDEIFLGEWVTDRNGQVKMMVIE